MSRTLVQVARIRNASPAYVYAILMHPVSHAAVANGVCDIKDEEGAEFSLGGGWVTGKNLKLEKGKKIVQLWRGKKANGEPWDGNHHSKVTMELSKRDTDTEIVLTQEEVPEDQCAVLTSGWLNVYWNPLNNYVALHPEKQAGEKDDHSHIVYVPGQVCWVEIPATNLQRGMKFYTDAFDWTWQQHVPEYALFGYKGAGKDVTRGDMFQVKTPIPKDETVKLHIFWPSVPEGVQRAVKAGATFVKDTFVIGPGIGKNALLRDTEGNFFMIYSNI